MTALWLLIPLLAGSPEDRETAVNKAVASKSQLLSGAGIKLSGQDRESLAEMERQYQDAKAISASISECLAELDEPDRSREVAALREKLNGLFAAYGSTKDKPSALAGKIRAYGKERSTHRELIERVRTSIAKMRFQMRQEDPTSPGSIELEVITTPANGELYFGSQAVNLKPGARFRTKGNEVVVYVQSADKREKMLAELSSSKNVDVEFYDGDKLTYKAKSGDLSTTWERGEARFNWQVLMHPEGSAQTTIEDVQTERHDVKGYFCRIAPKAYASVIELRVTGTVEWKMSSIRNSRAVHSAEKNPVSGTLRLRIMTL